MSLATVEPKIKINGALQPLYLLLTLRYVRSMATHELHDGFEWQLLDRDLASELAFFLF